MNNDFPVSCRLRKSWEYQQAWKMGCKLYTPHFILLLAENSHNNPRLGMTVSRKVGNAVMRNQVKRYVREFFRQRQHNFLKNVDLSIVAKSGSASLSFKEICAELQQKLAEKGHLDG